MRIAWHIEAQEELREFKETTRKKILEKTRELEDKPLNEDTSLFNKRGLRIYRLKLKNDELDHRVLFDISEKQIIILGVEHRDNAYTTDSIQKIKSRK